MVIDAPPDLPSLVAVMVAVPAATAVTMPPAETVATLGFDVMSNSPEIEPVVRSQFGD
jgi:hypothetical protein